MRIRARRDINRHDLGIADLGRGHGDRRIETPAPVAHRAGRDDLHRSPGLPLERTQRLASRPEAQRSCEFDVEVAGPGLPGRRTTGTRNLRPFRVGAPECWSYQVTLRTLPSPIRRSNRLFQSGLLDGCRQVLATDISERATWFRSWSAFSSSARDFFSYYWPRLPSRMLPRRRIGPDAHRAPNRQGAGRAAPCLSPAEPNPRQAGLPLQGIGRLLVPPTLFSGMAPGQGAGRAQIPDTKTAANAVLAACRRRLVRKRCASCGLRSILEPRNHGNVGGPCRGLSCESCSEKEFQQVRLRCELPTDFPDRSTERQARWQRMALEGAQALKEASEKAASIRANMARLRKLRLSKEAAEKLSNA